MPVLDSTYISTWWYFIDPVNGYPLIVDNYSETQTVELQTQSLLQGDIGVHTQNVGGMFWETTLSAPLLVFLDTTISVSTILNSIIDGFNYIRTPQSGTTTGTPVSLLQSAKINFTESGTTATCTFLSDAPGIFGYTNYQTDPGFTPDFIARNARFYDTSFNLNIGLAGSNFYQIISGSININVTIQKNYFIGTNQLPWFSAQGYALDGDVVVMAKPGSVGAIPMQQTDVLVPAGNSTNQNENTDIILSLAGQDLSLGSVALSATAKYDLKPSQITTYSTTFKTYVNLSTPFSG